MPNVAIGKAARILAEEGVIAYPTEGVYGLGCRPDSAAAVARLLNLKQRNPDLGLLLIAGELEQLATWVEASALSDELRSPLEKPVSWIVPATANVPYWISGAHAGVGVRLSSHPTVTALCAAANSALVSTSANLSGRPPARNPHTLRRHFGRLVDFVVPGDLGPAKGPSEIRMHNSGETLRPAAS